MKLSQSESEFLSPCGEILGHPVIIHCVYKTCKESVKGWHAVIFDLITQSKERAAGSSNDPDMINELYCLTLDLRRQRRPPVINTVRLHDLMSAAGVYYVDVCVSLMISCRYDAGGVCLVAVGVMDVQRFWWMSLCDITELWRSVGKNSRATCGQRRTRPLGLILHSWPLTF